MVEEEEDGPLNYDHSRPGYRIAVQRGTFIYLMYVWQRLNPSDHSLLQFLSRHVARKYGRECQKVVDGVRLIVGRK